MIFRDVDEQRRAERTPRGSEARKVAILDMALDAIITIDHEGTILEWVPPRSGSSVTRRRPFWDGRWPR